MGRIRRLRLCGDHIRNGSLWDRLQIMRSLCEVWHPDPEIPDARASGFIFPIPAKSGFPISRIRDSGQIGIPDFPNPGFRPNRDARFPKIRDSGQIGIQIRENPDFFCSGQNRDCTLSAAGQAIAFPRRGPWVGKEAHRPMNRSRQRLHGPVEAHTT